MCGKEILRVANAAYNLHIFYDAQNRPAVVRYNSQNYGYVYNLQGDVIAIIDSAGTKVVEYKYDAWGKILSKTGSMASTLGTYNPFRYRHYVYDEECQMYYLRSRYYKPEVGRFVNVDKQLARNATILEPNVFCYCVNNWINCLDSEGCNPEYYGPIQYKWMWDLYWTIKDIHYGRNENNPEFPCVLEGTIIADTWNDEVAANCHQFTAPQRDNQKFVSPDGKYEVIYDAEGNLVTDPMDVGTYNYVPSTVDPIGHFFVDVVPWLIFGNSPEDSTNWVERMLSFVGIYIE